ncbi:MULTISPECIES: GspH/FimT family pseudopilin [Roseateles]|uniref:Type II secretion system protein H n=1 Tax=Pelomonas aquatica TaxID=431058 RepID=A0ABU1ZBJ6_9BURK|nr:MULTISPECIES: GspH/FimT family pseudopilin [Roseateles]KQY89031.1 hypothetical protein ASD35_16085 [Pelomonas sp. Root1444]MDR7297989.1 type IV fimbrial biogenesis protein FimT [Pelomonas aquatica]
MLNARHRGFSLIELLVAVSVLAILMAMAIPNFTTWIRNARVRTVAESLQSSIRLAQAEAQRRNQTVVLFRTNSKDCLPTSTADAAGAQWQIRSVPNPLMTDDIPVAIQCGVLTDVSAGVNLTSPTPGTGTAVCFAGDGRQTTLTNPTSIGLDCTAAATTYLVAPAASSAENRPLQLDVSLSGAVRMCDPGKASTAPDSCRR